MVALRGLKMMAVAIAGAAIAAPTAAFAQESGLDSGDTAWILTATALVLFMTLPGLALFYGGLVRAQNVLSVLMHVFVIACLAIAGIPGLSGFFSKDATIFSSGVGGNNLFCGQTRTKRKCKRTDFFKIERHIEIHICLLPVVRRSQMFRDI